MRRANVAQADTGAVKMFQGLGCSALEALAVVGGRAPSEFSAVGSEARALLQATQGPFIALVSHTANWELALLEASASVPLACVVKRIKSPAIDSFCTRLRGRGNVQLLPERNVLASASAALADGRSVVFPMDQVPPVAARPWPQVQWLGAMAHIDTAPFVLAARLGVPVLLFAQHRTASGGTEISVLASFAPPKTMRAAWVRGSAVQAARHLESFVRAHPASWLWLHRRWRAPRHAPHNTVSAALGPPPCALRRVLLGIRPQSPCPTR